MRLDSVLCRCKRQKKKTTKEKAPVLTHGLFGVGFEAASADGGAGAAGGRWRRLAQLQRVADVVVPVDGLPFITAAQRRDEKDMRGRKEETLCHLLPGQSL